MRYQKTKLKILSTILVSSLQSWGCASLQVTSTPPQAAVEIELANGTRTPLGETPYSSSLGEVADKAGDSPILLVLKKEGFLDEKVLVPGYSFGNLSLAFELKANPTAKQTGASEEDLNKTFSLILQSYSAMIEGRFETATSKAKEAEQLQPKVAAPLILQGLIEIRKNNKGAATGFLEKAKNLYPEDPGINFLIQLSKK